MMHPACAALTVGDKVKHLKRGSEYLIVGEVTSHTPWKDQDRAVLVAGRWDYNDMGVLRLRPVEGAMSLPRPALMLPVSIQISINLAAPGMQKVYIPFLIYSPLLGQESLYEARQLFARPRYEFSPDRFVAVE